MNAKYYQRNYVFNAFIKVKGKIQNKKSRLENCSLDKNIRQLYILSCCLHATLKELKLQKKWKKSLSEEMN